MECNHGNGDKKYVVENADAPGAIRWAKDEIRTLEVKLAKHKSSLALLVVTNAERATHDVLMRESVKNMLVKHAYVGKELVAVLREFANHLEAEIRKGGYEDAEVHGSDGQE